MVLRQSGNGIILPTSNRVAVRSHSSPTGSIREPDRRGNTLFEAMNPGPDGQAVIVKHEHFAWRNGNQIMTATEGSGISAAEITAIRAAMRGVALRERELHGPTSGTSSKLYLVAKP